MFAHVIRQDYRTTGTVRCVTGANALLQRNVYTPDGSSLLGILRFVVPAFTATFGNVITTAPKLFTISVAFSVLGFR